MLHFKLINLIFKLVMTVHANFSEQLDADRSSVTNVKIVRSLDPNILKHRYIIPGLIQTYWLIE